MKIICDNCGTALKLDKEALGKRAKCPKCEQIFSVPSDLHNSVAEIEAETLLTEFPDVLSHEERSINFTPRAAHLSIIVVATYVVAVLFTVSGLTSMLNVSTKPSTLFGSLQLITGVIKLAAGVALASLAATVQLLRYMAEHLPTEPSNPD